MAKKHGYDHYRIQAKELGERVVLQVYGTEAAIDNIQFETIEEWLLKNVRDIQGAACSSMTFRLPIINYHARPTGAGTSGEVVLNDENDRELRVAVAEEGIRVNAATLRSVPQVANITVAGSAKAPVFDFSSVYPETVRAAMRKSDVVRFTHYFFLDIVMAHCEPIAAVVTRYLEEHNHESLFDEKVRFILEEYSGNTCFGKISKDLRYVTFASVADKNGKVDCKRYIEIWDHFIQSRLSKYFPDKESIYHYLTSKRGHSGQINRRRLYSQLDRVPSGPIVVLLPYARPPKTIHLEDAIGSFRFEENCKKNWHGQIGVATWDEYLAGPLHLIKSQKLEPYKIFKK